MSYYQRTRHWTIRAARRSGTPRPPHMSPHERVLCGRDDRREGKRWMKERETKRHTNTRRPLLHNGRKGRG